jgi:hypothetical protein
MNRLALMAQNVGRLTTEMGACFPGSHAVFRGHDLHAELRDMDWVELYLFGITGRRFSPEQVRLVHALWTHTSYPDTRLWNNRVAALAASVRSTPALGISAALAISDAKIFGGQPGVRAMEFLQRLQRRVAAGEELEALVLTELAARRIYGYGRPLNSLDERIPWLMDLVKELGLADGPHLKLAFAVEAIVFPRNAHLRMNYAAVHAALLADMGLSIREYQLLRIPTFLAGMPPCFVEAADKPEATLFPVPCSQVQYTGAPRRAWPDAEAADAPAIG